MYEIKEFTFVLGNTNNKTRPSHVVESGVVLSTKQR
jgi:hypothetical protein